MKLWDFIIKLAKITAWLVGLAAGVITIVVFLRDTSYSLALRLGFAGVGLAVLLLFVRLTQGLADLNRLIQVLGNRLHLYSHTVRDAYSALRTAKRKNQLNEEQIYDKATATTKDCADYLADVLTELSGKNVVVTLQFFRGLVAGADDTPDYVVSTLARSHNCTNQDQRVDRVMLSQHAPYNQILHEGLSHYLALDLEKVAKEHRKLTGTDLPMGNLNWRNAYKSLVVVPIRIKWNIHESGPRHGVSHVLMGFLSLDSNERNPFSATEAEAYCSLAKGFADGLFHYLERVDYYLDQVRPPALKTAVEEAK